LGGLARKATILDKQSAGITNFYVVDAGNLFFKSNDIDPGVTLEAAKINSAIIVESFNAMGCNVFSPGEFDFSGGLDHLLELEKKADFPFVSCNIFDSSGSLMFEKYILNKNKEYNIAFIGLSSIFDSGKITIGDPLTSIKETMEELEGISDINILLFHGNDIDLNNLYTLGLDIDLIIRSKDRKRSSDGGNKIPTFSLGDRGKIVYQFDLMIRDLDNELTDVSWCENTVKRVSNRLEKMKKGDLMADLNELYKDNPATLRRIENYENQIIKADQKLGNLVNSLNIEKIELAKTIDGRIDILQIVDKGKLKIQKNLGPVPDDKGRAQDHPHHGHGH
jgi:2',3'-cyclic-nucleotide 2'-phosphodiesterase (5'-nucleotidase family)